jgi:hypothetical protein
MDKPHVVDLTLEERQFIIGLMGKVTINILDSNAVLLTHMAKSISDKLSVEGVR